MGWLATVIAAPQLNRITEQLLNQIEAPRAGIHDVRAQIQTIGTISRFVGYRLGSQLPRIIPLFLRHLGNPEDELDMGGSQGGGSDDEGPGGDGGGTFGGDARLGWYPGVVRPPGWHARRAEGYAGEHAAYRVTR